MSIQLIPSFCLMVLNLLACFLWYRSVKAVQKSRQLDKELLDKALKALEEVNNSYAKTLLELHALRKKLHIQKDS